MFIAIVDFTVAPENRPVALAALAEDAPVARSLPGNVSFRTFSNTGDDTHLGIFQEWETVADFERYVASPGFAKAGQALRPLMTSAPVSRRFEAKLFEEVRA